MASTPPLPHHPTSCQAVLRQSLAGYARNWLQGLLMPTTAASSMGHFCWLLPILRTLQIRSGQESSELTDKIRSRLLHLDVSPRRHVYTSRSNPECHAKKPATFAATVIQKTATKLCFEHLWRSSCCASKAPGQPPAKLSRCNVFSGVRQRPLIAADLSTAYARNVKRLNPIYTKKTIGLTGHRLAT